MTRPTRTFRSQWVKPAATDPAPAPLTNAQQKALRLPRPGPGIVVQVPLDCLIEYMALYRLAPNGIQEPKVQPKNGPGEAILLVRRLPKGATDEKTSE